MKSSKTHARKSSQSRNLLFAGLVILVICAAPADAQHVLASNVAATSVVPAPPPATSTAPGTAISTAPVGDSTEPIHLLVGRSVVVSTPTRVSRVSIADPAVLDALVVSPQQVLLTGKTAGSASLVLWDESGQSQSFDVFVDIDIQGLRSQIKAAFPDQAVTVRADRDAVILSGQASTQAIADKMLEMAKASSTKAVSAIQVPVPSAAQVLLQVKFADVNRSALTELGFNILSLPGAKNIGAISTQQYGPPQLPSGQPLTGSTGGFSLSDILNIFLYRPDIDLAAAIRALQEKDLLQILAEPNVLTQSGKDASFLAGGEFPYPVVQNSGTGLPTVSIQFKEFGVKLDFTPTVSPEGVIHLKVAPEVSSLDFTNALTIQGFVIPSLSTRRVSSEMELRDGQSFAIAGLINDQITDQFQKIPGLGDIPLFGKLFQSRNLNKSKDELLVLVTPRIVQPIKEGEPLPKGPNYPERFLPPAPPPKSQQPAGK